MKRKYKAISSLPKAKKRLNARSSRGVGRANRVGRSRTYTYLPIVSIYLENDDLDIKRMIESSTKIAEEKSK